MSVNRLTENDVRDQYSFIHAALDLQWRVRLLLMTLRRSEGLVREMAIALESDCNKLDLELLGVAPLSNNSLFNSREERQ